MNAVFCFACSVRGQPDGWGETHLNARSSGAAKSEFLSSVNDAFDKIRYVDIRVRKVGGPLTSAAFKRVAAYRNMPGLTCGQRVRVDGSDGTVIGHTDSATFTVLFDLNTEHRGLAMPVHPSELVLI